MKKVLVISALPDSLIRFRYQLIKDIAASGHTVTASGADSDSLSGCMSGADVSGELGKLGVTYRSFPLDRTGTNPLRDLTTLRYLYKLCREVKPDTVFAYTVKPVVYGSIAARLAGVKSIYSMVTGLGYGVSDESAGNPIVVGIVRRLYSLAFSANKTVIFQNPDDCAELKNKGMIAPRTKTAIVNGSGVDLTNFTPTELPTDKPRFLLIARLLRDKGIREYAEAARIVKAKHPEAQFTLVGPLDPHPDAVTRDELDSWVSDGILEWLGPVADVRPSVSASNVFVLPSYHEGTPRTVLEAMAMGRPIITTDAPGCRQTVIDSDNGFLVAPRDAESLAAAMEKVILQPDMISSMGKRSRQLAEDKYDVRKVNQHMLEIMELNN